MSADQALRTISRRRGPGFTLIEIMLVVVIIGLLSTFAMPYYQRMTARARRTEAMVVLDKLRVYFVNQFESNGTFLTPEVVGMLGAGITASAWNPAEATPTGQPAQWSNVRIGWQQIPFSFEGGLKLRYQYTVADKTMTIHVVGDMPGLGAPLPGGPPSGNYTYTETLEGPTVTSVEFPAM